jgi:hypothetical protein
MSDELVSLGRVVSLIHAPCCHVRPSPGAGRAGIIIRARCRRRDWKTEDSDDEVIHASRNEMTALAVDLLMA